MSDVVATKSWPVAIDFIMLRGIFGCGSWRLVTSKMEFFAVIANDWKSYDELYCNES